jgi:hypothetical protein
MKAEDFGVSVLNAISTALRLSAIHIRYTSFQILSSDVAPILNTLLTGESVNNFDTTAK